jgi:S-methylmethionine-dependent homocysteine/selenocysteine methylase
LPDNISWLEKRIHRDGSPVILDGGMGTHLEKSGVPMDSRVWSSRAVLSHPDAVRKAHEEFISAGAEVIITNTFSAARHMLEPGGLGDRVKDINLNAVSLAQQARDNIATEPVAIVGSICEWAPTDDPEWHTEEAISRSTREQAELLAEADVDIIAMEMCQETEFSIAAIEAAQEVGLPIWIGICAQTNEGSSVLSVFDYEERDFESQVEAVAEYPAMMMNIMHTPIPDVDRAFEVVRRYWNGPVGIYPESGYFTMPNWQFVDVIEPDELAEAAKAWIDNGVRMVGGCCGLGPEHISALRQTLT